MNSGVNAPKTYLKPIKGIDLPDVPHKSYLTIRMTPVHYNTDCFHACNTVIKEDTKYTHRYKGNLNRHQEWINHQSIS